MTALMGLSQILRTARLQVITDLRGGGTDFADFCDALFNAGVDMIQVRETGLDEKARVETLEAARQVAFDHRRLLVVGRDLATATAFGADAFHLGASDGALAKARAALNEYALIGRSVHSDDELAAATESGGADYLLVGPVFGRDVPGPELIRHAAAQISVTDAKATPWFAVGGITPDNLAEVIDAGAVRVSVSSAVTKAADPAEVAGRLSDQLRQVWRDRDDLRSYSLSTLSGGGGVLGGTSVAPPPE